MTCGKLRILKETLDTLNRTAPPPAGKRFLTYKQAAARIGELEAALGLPKGEAIFNIGQSNARIRELEAMQAARVVSAAPALAAEPAPVATANVKSLAKFLALPPDGRRQYAADGGRLAHADFNALPVSAKMNFCVNGGQICDLELNGNTRTQGGLPK